MAPTLLLVLKGCVVTLLCAVGLGTRASDLTYLFQRPWLLARSLFAMYVAMPLAALAIAQAVPLPVGVRTAILVLTISAGAPLLPRKLMRLGREEYVISLAVLTLGFACTLRAQDRPAGQPDSSATSLDWEGAYRGVLPCADCEGIETTITLGKDGVFRLQTRYLGKGTEIFEQQGTIVWDAAGGMVTLDGLCDRPSRYLVGENHLVQLDMEGRRITGALADRYRLQKIVQEQPPAPPSLTETRWRLTELYGQPVKPEAGKEPYLILTQREGRVQGFGGCNTFTGSYELKEGNRIRFSGVAATMMACLEMTSEPEFFKVLQEADNHSLRGTILSLNRARMAPLARFEAVPAP